MRANLPWILVLVLALVTFAPLAKASGPTLVSRSLDYRADLSELPTLQNADGGFGPLLAGPNGTTNGTEPGSVAILETVLAIHLLSLEGHDPLSVATNHQGQDVSLAASNITNALDWLRAQENAKTGALPGDLALIAVAYAELGDAPNADRILSALLAREAVSDDALPPRDALRLLAALRLYAPELNETENATHAALRSRVLAAEHPTPEGLAWANVALGTATVHRDHLIALARDGARFGHSLNAQIAWGLAATGGPDVATDQALIALNRATLDGLAHVTYLLSERTANFQFSPHYEGPIATPGSGSTSVGSGARDPGTGRGSLPAVPVDEVLAENERLRDELARQEGQFPIPAWVMALSLLFVLGVLGAVGLAYGLKREDLTGVRRQIFDYIEANPGEHFSKVRRALGLAPGTFQHHLSVLESEGWITSHKDARYKRYFVNGNRYQQLIAGYTYKQKFAALANQTTRDFVRFVAQNPGATQKMVAERLSIHPSTVNWHANRLKQAGILTDERAGKEVRYTVDGDVVEKMLQPAEAIA